VSEVGQYLRRVDSSRASNSEQGDPNLHPSRPWQGRSVTPRRPPKVPIVTSSTLGKNHSTVGKGSYYERRASF